MILKNCWYYKYQKGIAAKIIWNKNKQESLFLAQISCYSNRECSFTFKQYVNNILLFCVSCIPPLGMPSILPFSSLCCLTIP